MSEIEKMYENANVKKKWNSTPYGGIEEYYPPFTAEKQLNILNALLNDSPDRCINIWKDNGDFKIVVTHIGTYEEFNSTDRQFSVALAKTVNNLWQDLTEEEKQQVKGILE